MTDEPMACQDFVELVTAYLEQALDSSTRALFDEHLLECDGCTNFLQQFHVTIETIGRTDGDQLDTQQRDRILETFRKGG